MDKENEIKQEINEENSEKKIDELKEAIYQSWGL